MGTLELQVEFIEIVDGNKLSGRTYSGSNFRSAEIDFYEIKKDKIIIATYNQTYSLSWLDSFTFNRFKNQLEKIKLF